MGTFKNNSWKTLIVLNVLKMNKQLNRLVNLWNDKELINKVKWTLSGDLLSKIILAFIGIVLSNFLSQEDYGKFGLIRNSLDQIVILLGFSLSIGVIKFISGFLKNKIEVEERLYRFSALSTTFSIGVSILISILILLIPNEIINSFFKGEISLYVKILVLFLPLIVYNGIIEGILKGEHLFKEFTLNRLKSVSLYILLTIILTYFFKLNGAFFSLILFNIILFLQNCKSVFKKNSKYFSLYYFKTAFLEKKTVLKISLPQFLSGLIEAPTFILAQIIIVTSKGFDALACIVVIMQIKNVITLVPDYLIKGLMPLFASKVNDNKADYANLFFSTRFVALILICFSVLPFLIFPSFFLGLFGSQYKNETINLYVALSSIPFFILGNLYNQDLIARGYTNLNLVVSLVWNMVFIILLFFLINHLDDKTMAFFIAQGGGFLVFFSLRYILYKRLKNRIKEL
jgi:PST family polysaccharide transporter